jgi:hypothetical protein
LQEEAREAVAPVLFQSCQERLRKWSAWGIEVAHGGAGNDGGVSRRVCLYRESTALIEDQDDGQASQADDK